MPANIDLQRIDLGGGAHPEEELDFVRALHSDDVGHPADWIVIDTPPAQSYFTRAALAAAHYVLIPIAIEPFAVRGIERVLESISAMRGLAGRGVRELGCVIARWQPTQAQERERAQLVDGLNARGVYLFNTKIPNDPHINSAHTSTSHGGVANLFHRGNAAAREYVQLLHEVKERINHVNARGE